MNQKQLLRTKARRLRSQMRKIGQMIQILIILIFTISCASLSWNAVHPEFESSILSDKTIFIKKFENYARTSAAKGVLSALAGGITGAFSIEDFPQLEESLKRYQEIVFLDKKIELPTENERFILDRFRFPRRINTNFVWEGIHVDYVIEGKINSAAIQIDLKSNTGGARVNITYYLKDGKDNLLFEKTITTKQSFFKEFKGGLLDAAHALKETIAYLDAALLENVLKFYGCFVEHERFGK